MTDKELIEKELAQARMELLAIYNSDRRVREIKAAVDNDVKQPA